MCRVSNWDTKWDHLNSLNNSWKVSASGSTSRVLAEGEITAGDVISRVAPASDSMSVTEILNLRFFDTNNHEMIAKARKLPALSPSWKRDFARNLQAKNLL